MEKWYKFNWSVKWWHFDFHILWSNWAIGLLFDAGRSWGGLGPQSKEYGIMLLLPCIVIRIHWTKRVAPNIAGTKGKK